MISEFYRMLRLILSLFFVATVVSGHSIFQEAWINGVDQGHEVGIRVPSSNSPIMNVSSNDIICNGGINPYLTPVSTVVLEAPAGAKIGAQWHHGLETAEDPSDPDDPIASSHKGPVIAYLAKVSDPLNLDATGLKWFKIWEDGYDNATQTWGVDRLIAAEGLVNFTIPSCIPAGYYLLRVEIIALHGASTYPGAQFYMECAQLQITGGGSKQPATVSFPGAYHSTDPGITINIYWPTVTNYTVPGPDVFTC